MNPGSVVDVAVPVRYVQSVSEFARYAISYCEIAAPPFESGASHDSATSPLPAIACRFLGAVGAVMTPDPGVMRIGADE